MNSTEPQHLTLSIPLGIFSQKLRQLAELTSTDDTRPRVSMHSRLSLVHQTAKAFAVEAAQQAGCSNPVVDIDELTNPPLYDLPIDPDDEQTVVIRFSYRPDDSVDPESIDG